MYNFSYVSIYIFLTEIRRPYIKKFRKKTRFHIYIYM